jgi:hypothetical protein
MALSQKPLNVSTRLVDSYKAAMGGLEETENKKAWVPPDEMGEHLTVLLNANPAFQWQPSEDENDEDIFNLDGFQWPLLSWHNWNLLTVWFGQITEIRWTSMPNDAVQFYRNTTKFLFLNSKSFQGTAMLYFGLTILSLGILTASITIATIYSSWLLWVVIFNILTMLVDLEECRKICPERVTYLFHQIAPFFQWFDRNVLQGKRTAGREWNKDEFELGDSQEAESLGFSLWNLPPPSIKEGKRLCINEDYMARKEWSQTTTKHVVAINFCYIMLHEEFLRKQASRRKKMSQESRSDSDPSTIYQQHGSSSNGDSGGGGLTTSVHTRTSWSQRGKGLMLEDVEEDAENLTRDQRLYRGSDSLAIITSISESNQHTMLSTRRASSLTCSPAEAIEVTRDRIPHFFGSHPDANRGIGVLPEDFGLSGANDFLPVDTSSSSSSSSAHAASQDLNMSSDNSFESATTDHVGNWMDVGAEIGLKILGSAHVQRAMASKETAERIKVTMEMQLGKRKAAQINANIAAAVPGLLDEDVLLGGNNPVDKDEVEKTRLPPPVPFHPMWTSAAAAATNTALLSLGSYSDQEEVSSHHGGEPQSEEGAGGEEHSLEGSSRRRKSSEQKKFRRRKNKASKLGTFFRDKLHRRSSSETNDQTEGGLGSFDVSVSPRGKHSRRRSSLSAAREAEAIEVVCGGKPDVTPKSTSFRVPLLLPGIKVVVPIFPIQPGLIPLNKIHDSRFQMGTVVSSQRIFVQSTNNQSGKSSSASQSSGRTNCLSLTVKLDKSFLRNGEFAEMTIRIMDAWGPRYVPKHSKLPIGSCVATSFGLGVLVGWRVEDDCHVIRSLWQRRGPGSACAYLRRDSIHATVEAAVGFEVGTPFGEGKVVAYVDGKRDYRSGRYFVVMKEDGRHKGKVLEFNRRDITSCHSARFIPIIELIREAAQYQLQVDNYEAVLRETEVKTSRMPKPAEIGRALPKYADIVWKSFLRAIEEDSNFDEGVNHFMTSVINFLERLDRPTEVQDKPDYDEQKIVITATEESNSSKMSDVEQKPGFWIMNDMFGGIFSTKERIEAADDEDDMKTEIEVEMHESANPSKGPTSIDRAFSVIRTLMRTVSIARAGCVNEPNFKLVLSICYEFLIFIKTVVKVQQKNVSPKSLVVWKRAWQEIVSTFGPVKERLEKIGKGIAERMEKQGRRAKIRLLRFADTIVKDDSLLIAMEQGDWDRCAVQLELAMVKAKIIDEENREHYHKTAQFAYGHFAFASARNSKTAAPKEKLVHLAKVVQWIAAPRRSLLKLFMLDGVLNVLERIFVRVFHKEEDVSRMLAIHASTFSTLRHFRMLKDFTIAGKLWIPLLDAADAEFSWVVSRMPENTKDLMSPIAKLFSLCVVQFHKISQGDLTKDWLDFLLEEEAVNIVHEINMKLILSLESFSREIKEMMVVLPYYPR